MAQVEEMVELYKEAWKANREGKPKAESNYLESIAEMLKQGATPGMFKQASAIACKNHKVPDHEVFKYFAGIVWNKVKAGRVVELD